MSVNGDPWFHQQSFRTGNFFAVFYTFILTRVEYHGMGF